MTIVYACMVVLVRVLVAAITISYDFIHYVCINMFSCILRSFCWLATLILVCLIPPTLYDFNYGCNQFPWLHHLADILMGIYVPSLLIRTSKCFPAIYHFCSIIFTLLNRLTFTGNYLAVGKSALNFVFSSSSPDGVSSLSMWLIGLQAIEADVIVRIQSFAIVSSRAIPLDPNFTRMLIRYISYCQYFELIHIIYHNIFGNVKNASNVKSAICSFCEWSFPCIDMMV